MLCAKFQDNSVASAISNYYDVYPVQKTENEKNIYVYQSFPLKMYNIWMDGVDMDGVKLKHLISAI